MTEIAALFLVGLAGLLGFLFWKDSGRLSVRTKVVFRSASIVAGLGLAKYAINWKRTPEPDVVFSGWPFSVIGGFKLPGIEKDLWHYEPVEPFVAAIAGDVALAFVVSLTLSWLAVRLFASSAR